MPVREAAQQRLGDDAGEAADGDDEAHIAVGKAASQQKGGLIGADGAEHGPKARLKCRMV